MQKCPNCGSTLLTEDNRADTQLGTYGTVFLYCEMCDFIEED